VAVETRRYAATSLTVNSVRNLSAESSVKSANACDCLDSEAPSSRVVARVAKPCYSLGGPQPAFEVVCRGFKSLQARHKRRESKRKATDANPGPPSESANSPQLVGLSQPRPRVGEPPRSSRWARSFSEVALVAVRGRADVQCPSSETSFQRIASPAGRTGLSFANQGCRGRPANLNRFVHSS